MKSGVNCVVNTTIMIIGSSPHPYCGVPTGKHGKVHPDMYRAVVMVAVMMMMVVVDVYIDICVPIDVDVGVLVYIDIGIKGL